MSLEDKVKDKESKGFMRKTLNIGFNLAMAGATTALSIATMGSTGLWIAGAFASGGTIGSFIKKKPLYETVNKALKDYSTINAIIYPVISAWDYIIPKLPGTTLAHKIFRTLFASTIFNVGFEGMYKGARHLIDNKLNPIGITKSIKSNFYNSWKRSAIGFSPAYGLVANGVSNIYGIPTFAYNALGLNLYSTLKPVPVAKHTPSYMPSYAPARA